MNTISGMNSDSEYEYIEFSKSHINYLKKVAQKRVPKEITKMFNDKFNSSSTKKELKEVMAEHNISYKRKNKISDWTEEQKQFLIQIAPFHTFIECAKLLNDKFHISRTPKAILHVADALKITTKECRVDNWTEEKLDFIKESAPHNTLTKCAEKFNKHFSTNFSRGTIRNKCNMLGVQCITKTHRSWSEEEKEYLKEVGPKNTIEETTELFNKKFKENQKSETVRNQCVILGIKTKPAEVKGRIKWTEAKVSFLREHAKENNLKELTEAFNERFKEEKNEGTIKQACGKHKITYKKTVFKLQPEHVEFLKKEGPGKTAKECAELFNKNFNSTMSDRMVSLHCKANNIELALQKKRRQSNKTKATPTKSKGKKWPENQISFLKREAQNCTLRDGVEAFNKEFGENITRGVIKHICDQNGIVFLSPIFKISAEQIEFLKKNAQGKTLKQLTSLFNKTYEISISESVMRTNCQDHDIKYKKMLHLNSEQIEFLKRKAPRKTGEEMVKIFNRKYNESISICAFQNQCRRLNIPLQLKVHKWTKEEIDFIKKRSSKYTIPECLIKFYQHFKKTPDEKVLRAKVKELGCESKSEPASVQWTSLHANFFTSLDPKLSFTERVILFNLHFNTKIAVVTFRNHLYMEKTKSMTVSSDVSDTNEKEDIYPEKNPFSVLVSPDREKDELFATDNFTEKNLAEDIEKFMGQMS